MNVRWMRFGRRSYWKRLPLKKTSAVEEAGQPPRTNEHHFKFLGFYNIKGNVVISKILKGNFVFAQDCGGAGRKMWGCRKKHPF